MALSCNLELADYTLANGKALAQGMNSTAFKAFVVVATFVKAFVVAAFDLVKNSVRIRS